MHSFYPLKQQIMYTNTRYKNEQNMTEIVARNSAKQPTYAATAKIYTDTIDDIGRV